MRTVVYHAQCRDGFAAAWAMRTIYPEAVYIAANYGRKPEGYPYSGQDVIFVDFSLPREEMIEIAEACATLRVLDHHKTAEEALTDFPRFDGRVMVLFDMERSGAGLAWDQYHVFGERPWFIDYVEDRDLWRFKLPDSKAINAYLGTRQFAFEEWDALMKPGALDVALEAGQVVERKTHAYVTEVCKNARPFFHAIAVNAPQVDISEVLAELLEIHPEAKYSIGWWQRADGRFQYGLRSRPGSDVDVSELAKTLGGGGHKHAAGFHHSEPLNRLTLS